MLQQSVTNVSFDSFRQISADKKVVILYPWTNYRNLFLSYFLNHAEEGLLYYRIPSEVHDLQTFIADMVTELATVLPDFGTRTHTTLHHHGLHATQLAEALAADLSDVQTKSRKVFYLDELDRVALTPDFLNFLETLVKHLPDDVQLAVNSRLLTYQPWIDMVKRADAAVLGTAHRRNNLMFTVESTLKPQLEVYAFGRGHVLVNGKQIENWDGALPRNLFYYFMDNELVTRDQIFGIFWETLTDKEATNVFHVTKRKITERISEQVNDHHNYELTRYGNGFYAPGDKIVRHYDVADFEAAINQAMVTLDDMGQARLYRRAVDIYKAPFLQTIDMPWVVERREKLRMMFTDALIGLGRIYKDADDPEQALGYFIRALKETFQREDIHREVMHLYWQLGRRSDAIAQYRLLQSHLQETVGIDPSRETRALYTQIEADS